MEQYFPEFPEEGKSRHVYTQIFGNFPTGFSIPFNFPLATPRTFGGVVHFSNFNHFRIFWKLSREISVPFVTVLKFSEFLVEWKML